MGIRRTGYAIGLLHVVGHDDGISAVIRDRIPEIDPAVDLRSFRFCQLVSMSELFLFDPDFFAVPELHRA